MAGMGVSRRESSGDSGSTTTVGWASLVRGAVCAVCAATRKQGNTISEGAAWPAARPAAQPALWAGRAGLVRADIGIGGERANWVAEDLPISSGDPAPGEKKGGGSTTGLYRLPRTHGAADGTVWRPGRIAHIPEGNRVVKIRSKSRQNAPNFEIENKYDMLTLF